MAEITLCRPEKRNAVGPAFSAGPDSAEMSAMPGREEFRRFLELIQETFIVVERLAVPTIAAVNGPTYGRGCELALACDFRLPAEDASLGVLEVKVGRCPAPAAHSGWPTPSRRPSPGR